LLGRDDPQPRGGEKFFGSLSDPQTYAIVLAQ
jgi:hypothetical protein